MGFTGECSRSQVHAPVASPGYIVAPRSGGVLVHVPGADRCATARPPGGLAPALLSRFGALVRGWQGGCDSINIFPPLPFHLHLRTAIRLAQFRPADCDKRASPGNFPLALLDRSCLEMQASSTCILLSRRRRDCEPAERRKGSRGSSLSPLCHIPRHRFACKLLNLWCAQRDSNSRPIDS